MKSGHRFIAILLLLFAQLYGQHPGQHNPYRDKWQQPQRIMDSIAVKRGMTIGEAGAGEGYFTLKLAERIGPDGIVYANDIDKERLSELDQYCRTNNLKNIITVIGQVEVPLFPANQLDMVVMMYVFHDLEQPILFLRNIQKYLKAGASVVIIDRDPAKFDRHSRHFMPKDEVLSNIQKADYQLIKIYNFLARDNIYVCKPLDKSDMPVKRSARQVNP